MAQLEKGHKLLDLGCGWGSLINHAAKEYGANAYGITLSKEQKEICDEKTKVNKLEDKIEVEVINAFDIKRNNFDRITCVEMSEHIGVLK